MVLCNVLLVRGTLSDTLGLLLTLCSGVTPDNYLGSSVMLEILTGAIYLQGHQFPPVLSLPSQIEEKNDSKYVANVGVSVNCC